MSADREMDHLENMSDMNGSGHYTPGQYHTTVSQDAELEAQQLADDAALRVARSSWANTKLLMKAMDVKL